MTQDHMPPPTPQELVSKMKDSYSIFLKACKALSEKQALKEGVCGEWCAKAVVDHLTGWQVQSLPIIKSLLVSDNPEFDLDIDAFNRTSVSDRKNLTWDESLQAFEMSFKSFEDGLDKIPVTRFRTEGGFKSWLTAMIHEYQFHLTHIQHAQSL